MTCRWWSASTCTPTSRPRWWSKRMRSLPTAPTPMSIWPTPAAPPRTISRNCCKTKRRLAKAFRQLPFLIPISWQCTNDQPARGIYQKLAALQSDAVPTLSFCPGFPAADFLHCGPSVFAYGVTQADADTIADKLVALIEGHENDFDGRIYSPDEGVRHAMELAKPPASPSSSPTPRTIRAPAAIPIPRACCVRWSATRRPAPRSARSMIPPPPRPPMPQALARSSTLALGGKSGISGDAPYEETFVVERLSDGQVRGARSLLRRPRHGHGAVGLLADRRRARGREFAQGAARGPVDVSLCRHRAQRQQAILVNKSSVHFRADFEPIAEKLLICAAPGAMPADTSALPWTKLRPGIRLKPNGPAFVTSVNSRSHSPRHRITRNAQLSTASKALPTNSPPSAGICTPIPRSASRRSAPRGSSPKSSRNGASRFIAGSAAPAWSACSRARAQARGASGFAPIWTRCRWKKTPI